MPEEITQASLIADINAHFENQAYDDVLACASLGAERFPDALPLFTYYRMCAAARLDDLALLRDIVDAALDQGLWYSEHVMRATPSFQSLQGNPVFERMVQANFTLQNEQIMAEGKPPGLTLAPEAAAPPLPVLLALHGNTSSVQAEAAPWSAAVAQGWLLAMPESSQAFWRGQYIWNDYDIAKRDVIDDYKALCADYDIDYERVVVGGFSLGAQTALRLLLAGLVPARGFVCNGPYVPDLEPWDAWLAGVEERNLRGYIVANEQDPTCTVDNIRALVDKFIAHEIPCELAIVSEPGHFYPEDFAAHLARGLDFVTSS